MTNAISLSIDAIHAPLHPGDLYLNRELSWLAFNSRVLDQAFDEHWPLLERVKFLAIFGSNLDEFFMIRVSGLHDQLASNVESTAGDGVSVREQLSRIRRVVTGLSERASELWARTLLPELEQAGICVRRYEGLSPRAERWARDYFRREVFPVLTPLAVDPLHPFPFLSNLSLSLAVEAEDPLTHDRRFARVKVPESLGRFVVIEPDPATRERDPACVEIILLEDLISANLGALFPGMHIVGCWPFRVTRDMDLEIMEEEAADLLALVDREVRRRRFGAAVRLEVADGVPDHIRSLLLEKLELEVDDLYETTGPLGLSGLFTIAGLSRKELHDAPLRQRLPRGWSERNDPFACIAERDILLHHPYDSFAPVLDLLRSAADDPNVLAIKMTLYRAGMNSEAVRALVRAAENGKQVAVAVELKARFDEEANILWARALERAGAHVFYGAPGLKTHAKALLVVRRESKGLCRYVHLSTGNYNAGTARLYTDLALLTTDAEIGEDVAELFNALSGFSKGASYRKLSVAPLTLRAALLEKIEEQRGRALGGESARVFAKLNSLVDGEIIRALYAASQAGVSVELMVRGVCCLRPQLLGVSDRIRVYSLVGRFLEHERVYAFGSAGEERIFLSSADWMPRNLDRRVEALFPIEDARLLARIRDEVMAPLGRDNSRVYEMASDGSYRRRVAAPGEAVTDGQLLAADRVHELDVVRSSPRASLEAPLASASL